MTAFRNIFAVAAVVTSALVSVSAANAGSGKEFFVQDYKFKQSMHGYSGHSGNYFCDYQRLPDRKCTLVNGVERCKIVGWTLRQMCQ